MQEYYKFLGVSAFASDEEITERYNELKKQFSNDRFLEGEAGNEAARKLTELNNAYNEIKDYRKEHSTEENRAQSFAAVDSLIKAGKINEAQAELDKFSERSAEWHYLQSVVFYRKNWVNESKKQLEIAIQMDDSNEKYKTAYDKLCRQMDFNAKNTANNANREDWNKSGNASRTHSYEEPTEMMGGDSCADFCCRMAVCNILLNCCCNCR
jgi:curved DNA-binding protein CbpA